MELYLVYGFLIVLIGVLISLPSVITRIKNRGHPPPCVSRISRTPRIHHFLIGFTSVLLVIPFLVSKNEITIPLVAFAALSLITYPAYNTIKRLTNVGRNFFAKSYDESFNVSEIGSNMNSFSTNIQDYAIGYVVGLIVGAIVCIIVQSAGKKKDKSGPFNLKKVKKVHIFILSSVAAVTLLVLFRFIQLLKPYRPKEIACPNYRGWLDIQGIKSKKFMW